MSYPKLEDETDFYSTSNKENELMLSSTYESKNILAQLEQAVNESYLNEYEECLHSSKN